MSSSSEPAAAFIHPQALCESEKVGAGTRVWAFAHILPGAVIGADCNICDHVFIENDVEVGDRVTVKCGVQLWDGLRLADDVFVGPNVSFSNDRYPRSRHHDRPVEVTLVERGASIGAGAVVLPGLRIGSQALVGAGAVVTHNVPPRAIVSGNPARIVGYIDTKTQTPLAPTPPASSRPTSELSVPGVTVHRLKLIDDLRGSLTVAECSKDLPFVPHRYFMVFDVPGRDVRGEHAHHKCQQFLIAARGSVSVVVDDGTSSEEVTLNEPNVGLYVPPLVWAVQYRYSADALLLVLASDPYDPADYIRDYDEFLSVRGLPASS